MKEKLAVEEEKKRKRAEKFGSAKPTNGTEAEGSVSYPLHERAIH
jgi:SAP domain-containing ribonucleoprotein